MTTRIEPRMTRTHPRGFEPHLRSLGLARTVEPNKTHAPSEYVKYPRLAKGVFALAAGTVVFAIVQSAAILIVTAWLLLVGYILRSGWRPDKVDQSDVFMHCSYPGGSDAASISRYGSP